MRTIPTLLASLLLTFSLACSVGCEREYPQSTPDETLTSAAAMVKDGRADLLTTLIYADSPEMRRMLDRMGAFLGRVQALSKTVAEKMPSEVAEAKDRAAKAIADGSAASFLSGAMSGPPNRRRDNAERAAADPDGMQDTWGALIAQIAADPYAWIEQNQPRLTTEMIDDEQAAVMLDAKPVPPAGLLMRKDGSRWYVVLPLNLPGVSRMTPQTPQEWRIISYIMKILETTVAELDADIRSGKIARLSQIGDHIGEKAYPVALVFIAYGREVDVRERGVRMVSEFRKRKTKWAESVAQSSAPVPEKLLDALDSLAAEPLRAEARKDSKQRVKLADLDDAAFVALVNPWLADAGFTTRLDAIPDAQRVEAEVERFSRSRAAPGK